MAITINGSGITSANIADGTIVDADLATPLVAGTDYLAPTGDGSALTGVGKVVQMVNYQTSTVSSTTSIIPWDNTIPQITEGAEFLSLSITPKSATNILIVEGVLSITSDIVNSICTKSLFLAGTSNALYTTNTYNSSVNHMTAVPMRYKMVAGATTPLTFSIRAGNHTAVTTTMNGWTGAVYYGGSWTSSIQITEFAP